MTDGKRIHNKILIVFSVLFLLAIIVSNCVVSERCAPKKGLLLVEPGRSQLGFEENDSVINGYDKNGATFFFIPSYINLDSIDQCNSLNKIYTTDGQELTDPLINTIQDVFVYGTDGSMTSWKIGFFRSENLYTINVSLDKMEYYDLDHDIYSRAVIDVISPIGRKTYNEKNALIKGRGNASWPPEGSVEKRPFQIKLPERVSLCGLSPSDKWVLISDGVTHLRDKITYDLANDMGMEYAIESEFADVYVNNEYMGSYLICHEPGIGTYDLDIFDIEEYNKEYADGAEILETENEIGYDYKIDGDSIPQGGYLFEHNHLSRYYQKKCGFMFKDGSFTIKSPDNASLDEIQYIRNFIQHVDATVHERGEEQLSLIDTYSFSRQYLMTEIALDSDSFITSYYFYKRPNEDKLYAGPCWDFDRAYGNISDARDYTESIFEIAERKPSESPVLDWDKELMDNSAYREYVRSVFCENVAVYEKLLWKGYDNYKDKIYRSSCMDYIRWNDYDDYETKVEAEYKYLRFFLINRLNFLADVYGVSLVAPEPTADKDVEHQITFIYNDETEEYMYIKDGTQLSQDELPEYDKSKYDGWHVYENGKIHGLLTYYDPIYSDYTLVLKKDEEENAPDFDGNYLSFHEDVN